MYRQHNDQKKQDKRTNNDLQSMTHKTTDRATRTPLKYIMIWKDKLDNTKSVIKIRKSKDRQYNDQKKKERSTNNDLQNTT